MGMTRHTLISARAHTSKTFLRHFWNCLTSINLLGLRHLEYKSGDILWYATEYFVVLIEVHPGNSPISLMRSVVHTASHNHLHREM